MKMMSINITSVNLKQNKTAHKFQPSIEAELILDSDTYIVRFNGRITTVVTKSHKPSVPELSKTMKNYITDIMTIYVAGVMQESKFCFHHLTDDCYSKSCRLEN